MGTPAIVALDATQLASDLTVLTYSSTNTYSACPRRYQLGYVERFRAVKVAKPLVVGTIIHKLIEAFWCAVRDGLDAKAILLALVAQEFSGYELARFRPLLVAYATVWLTDTWTVLEVEKKFRMPLRDPQGRVSKRFALEGKIDRIMRGPDNIQRLVEVKTAGVDVSEGSPYRQRLALDEQISMYCDGAEALGYAIDRVTYDVLVKPRLRPKMATPPDDRKYTLAKYSKPQYSRVTKARPEKVLLKEARLLRPPQLRAGQREVDETVEEFELRVAQAIAKDPAAFIVRFRVPRDAKRTTRFRLNLVSTSRHIALDTDLGYFAEKSHACEQPGRRCQFAPHCLDGIPLADTTTFTRVDAMHTELLEDEAEEDVIEATED